MGTLLCSCGSDPKLDARGGAAQEALVDLGSCGPSNVALNTSASGFPSPLESDLGAAGAPDHVWDILDGVFDSSSNDYGLGFLPTSTHQITIDFGRPVTFDGLTLRHHPEQQPGFGIPKVVALEYFDGAAWLPISDPERVLVPSVCGDGVVQAPEEECDGGTFDETTNPGGNHDHHSCTRECRWNRCGDGTAYLYQSDASNPNELEQCDDGNANNADACVRADLDGTDAAEECRWNVCMDAFVYSVPYGAGYDSAADGVSCPEGVLFYTTPIGEPAFCDNPFPLEECDDGGLSDNDSCVALPRDDENGLECPPNGPATVYKCAYNRCGDGFVYAILSDTENPSPLEQCDEPEGSPRRADNGDSCIDSCAWNTCGDGFHYQTWTDPDHPDASLTNPTAGLEPCDDGNQNVSDHCVMVDNPGYDSGFECGIAFCGDGFVEAGVEGCDDGNALTWTDEANPPDDCGVSFARCGTEARSEGACACQLPYCGDGSVQTGQAEECDEGASAPDGPDGGTQPDPIFYGTCTGSAVVELFEEPPTGDSDGDCEAGEHCECAGCPGESLDLEGGPCNFASRSSTGCVCAAFANDNDSCLHTCQWNGCRDGRRYMEVTDDDNPNPPEQCDDFSIDMHGACVESCEWNTCGDAYSYTTPYSGDAVGIDRDVHPAPGDQPQACDRAGPDPGIDDDEDGQLDEGGETGFTSSLYDDCLNANPFEECDDGDLNSDDGCITEEGGVAICRLPSTGCPLITCGNGVEDPFEECDDGNDVDDDECTNACVRARCGDGIVQGFFPFDEECDDGDPDNTDACTNVCRWNICGDGVRLLNLDDVASPGVFEQCDVNILEIEQPPGVGEQANCPPGISGNCGDGFWDEPDFCANDCELRCQNRPWWVEYKADPEYCAFIAEPHGELDDNELAAIDDFDAVEAESHCESFGIGATLVRIGNASQNDELHALRTVSGDDLPEHPFWIGLVDRSAQTGEPDPPGDWFWIEDDTPLFGFAPWFFNGVVEEPQDGDNLPGTPGQEDCAFMVPQEYLGSDAENDWADWACDTLPEPGNTYFFCEFPPDALSQSPNVVTLPAPGSGADRVLLQLSSGPPVSRADNYAFTPVSGSKVRWNYDGDAEDLAGQPGFAWHAVIDEFEVHGCFEPPAPEAISGNLPAGGSLSTDGEADGATPGDPIETRVTTPLAGLVSIDEEPFAGGPPGDFVMLGMQIEITAPAGTVANPLRFTFTIDGSLLPPGAGPGDVEVFRNGTRVLACTAPPLAVPDPCVVSRVSSGDDVVITVATSTASLWTFGVARDSDRDGDGTLDAYDRCPLTPPGAAVGPGGCSIAQRCPCAGPAGGGRRWRSHGDYVACVSDVGRDLLRAQRISRAELARTVRDAGRSRCGHPPRPRRGGRR